MAKWLVITTCPIHDKPVHLVVEATDQRIAEEKAKTKTIDCPYSPSHKFKIEKVDGVTFYPWRPPTVSIKGLKGVVTYVAPPKRVETEAEAPTLLQSSRRKNGIIDVTITRGNETLSIIYPQNEVHQYDTLMAIAKPAGQAKLINGILALLIAHVGTTKSLATGFLRVSGFKETTVSSVGEALSRLKRGGIIYTFDSASFTFTRYPLGLGPIERTVTSEVFGEPMYGISTTVRLHILERLKFEPHLAWWRMLKPEPALQKVRATPAYEWVQITKAAPRFRSADDYKYYGPYSKDAVAKIPLAFAYFLVRTGYAKWLNSQKEDVINIENLLRTTTIEKVKKQATLF